MSSRYPWGWWTATAAGSIVRLVVDKRTAEPWPDNAPTTDRGWSGLVGGPGLYMGHTDSGDRRHVIRIRAGQETTALCGVTLVRYTMNRDGAPVRFADHWRDQDLCEHCDGIAP